MQYLLDVGFRQTYTDHNPEMGEMGMVKLSLMTCAILVQSTAALADGRNIISLVADKLPSNMAQHNINAVPATFDNRETIKITYHKADWPNVFFNAPGSLWDWSGCAGVAVDVYNPGAESVEVNMRVDNAGADGINNCANGNSTIEPGCCRQYGL